MRNFIYKIVAVTLPVLGLLLGVNYFGDAARLFDDDYEKKIATIILDGKNATNVANYDDRILQKEIITDANQKPAVIVIGGSRAMQINSAFFPDTSFQNNSVSGASIEDLISIYQLYKDNNKLPKKILIGVEPWTFNDNRGDKRWESIGESYYKFSGKEIQQKKTKEKYKELFSISYFQNSVKFLPKVLLGKSDPEPTMNRDNRLLTKLSDGSLVYGTAMRDATQVNIDSKINAYISPGPVYGLENFNSISDIKWKEFESVIIDMHKNNIAIEFVLSPFAPVVYKCLQKDYPLVLKVEDRLRVYSAQNNIKIYGSFDPIKCKLDKTFFYDGMHVKQEGIIKVIKANDSLL